MILTTYLKVIEIEEVGSNTHNFLIFPYVL